MNQLNPLAAAEQAIRDKDTQRACEILQANLSDKKHFFQIRLMLAELHLNQKKHHLAEDLLIEASSQAPEHTHSLTRLAYIARTLGKTIDAAEYLERASRVTSASQNELKFLSSEFMALGYYREAITVLQKIDPMDVRCLYYLGLANFKLGQTGKALPIYRKLFSSIPDNSTIARELSLVAATFRDYDTAVEAYTRYMQLIQPNANDFLKFSDLQLMSHNVTESERHLNTAIAMGEDRPSARLLKARLCRLKGEFNTSLEEARNVIAKQPESGTAWQIISELIDSAAIDPELIELLKNTITSPGINIQDKELAQFALSELLTKLRDYKAAYREMCAANQTKKQFLFNQGIQYNPPSVEAQFEATKKVFQAPSCRQSSTSKHQPIFIVGMPRSGTTVVNRILQATEQLQCIGESESIPYIHSQLQLRFGGGPDLYAEKLLPSDWDRLAADYLQRVKAKSVNIVDKMPSNCLHIGMILTMFPQAKIIQMRRNPFDVCMSIFSKPFPEGHSYACDVNHLAHFYVQTNTLMDFWCQHYPEQIFNLNFDHFLESPSDWGAQMFSFLGYEWHEEYLAPPQKASQAFTFSELQARKAISKKEAQKWKAFTKIASDLNEAIAAESLKNRQTW